MRAYIRSYVVLTADGDGHRTRDRDEPGLSAERAGAHLGRRHREARPGDVDAVEAHRARAVRSVTTAHGLLEGTVTETNYAYIS